MRSRFLSLALLLLFAHRVGAQSSSPAAMSQLTTGSRVRVEGPGVAARRLVGTLLLPPSDSLLIADENGPPVTLRPSQISSLEVSRGRNRIGGGVRGAIVGVAVGAALGVLFAQGGEATSCMTCPPASTTTEDALTMGAIGGGAGFLIGALVGRERWAPVQLAPAR